MTVLLFTISLPRNPTLVSIFFPHLISWLLLWAEIVPCHFPQSGAVLEFFLMGYSRKHKWRGKLPSGNLRLENDVRKGIH